MTKLRVAVTALCAAACVAAGATIASAAAGTPEIDRANANIQLSGSLNPVRCVGEDAIPYITYIGGYRGGESQVVPDPTDYPLSGPLVISGINWTINLKTMRGVLNGEVTLSTAAGPDYTGRLILVTQGLPAAGALVPARGWINAAFKLPDEGTVPGDDNLIANVEFKLGLTSAIGHFGDLPASFNTPNYSVVTNVAPNALDGVC
jgi:hypothetical protein